ncbi:hypothetical protein E8E12_007415 [Didymella heteroderae]|uniref:Beta-xylosidase C-terminal Concanavalin A-like domain-containing protein n=1 Tax=Didymella heteroderae TaxID=1769908 RepID=A0A9P5BZU5_9PLEO|nr:hypothetical protein E8E12_007415 [Didymella heteroderae]
MAPTFQNPIIRGFNPDPTVCVVPSPTPGGKPKYYLSTSTFEYFPGCAIYRSSDGINWTLIGHALTRPSQLNLRTVEPGAGSWASTLRYRQDEKRWYLFNGVFHRYRPSSDERIFPRGFYVWTDDIDNDLSWSDPVYFDNPGFDQDVFWDDDGKTYLSTTVRVADRDPASKLKDFAIHISEIDLPTGRTLTPPVCIRQSQYGVAEGSHIIKKDEYYYLFVAEGGTEVGHQEWVFRSKNGVYGPWESQGKPLWYNGSDEEVQRTGHADVFEDEQGRETFLVKVEWVNGWPVFNDGKNIRFETESRDQVSQLVARSKPGSVRWQAALGYGSDNLELGWYQKNTPLKAFHSLTERPNYLRIYGGCYDLSSPEAPALLLRKQESFHDRFSTTLEFNPSRKGYEAGITVWWSMYSFASIGITLVLRRGELIPTVVCRQPTGAAGKMTTMYPAIASRSASQAFDASAPAELSAQATPTTYTMELSQGQFKWAFPFNTKDLCIMPPVGGAFTGTMFGIYSFGLLEPVLDPADFKDIMIRQQGW